MALFGRQAEDRRRGLERETEMQVVQAGTVEGRPGGDAGAGEAEVEAFLGRGSCVEGKLRFEGVVRIEGRVEGEISAGQRLLVGETAVVNAEIRGSSVVIKGRVTGDIHARERVEILAPGRLYGNITTPSLVIEEGVVFEGRCSMGVGEAEGGEGRVTAMGGEVASTEQVELGVGADVGK